MILKDIFKRRDLTSGSIPKNIILNTIPLWIGTIFYVGFNPWELYLVGKLGTESIAALAIGRAGLMLFWTAVIGMSNITIALIGSLVGGKNIEEANLVAKEILIITFFLSLTLAIIGYLVTPGLLSLIGAEPEVLNLAIPYLRILLVGGIIAFPAYVINSILRGTGEMRIPMIIVCGEIALNGILLFPLIFGLKMGFNGVALAWLISGAIGTLVGLWILIKGKSVIKIELKDFKSLVPRFSTLKEVRNLAGLNTLEIFLMQVFALVMISLIAPWGTPAIAAYGIGQRLLMMVALPGFDLATTSNIIMANNLGAKKIKRAETSCWQACGLNALIMAIGGMIILSLTAQIVGLFDKNPEVVRIGVDYFRITIPGWLFLAFWFVLRRGFVGAKDVKSPFFITLFGLGGLQIPLAYYLPKLTNLDLNGIWWAILIAASFQGLMAASWFKRGGWKPKDL